MPTHQVGPEEKDTARVTFVPAKAAGRGPRTMEELFSDAPDDSSDGRSGGGGGGGGRSSTGRRDPPPYNRGTAPHKPSSFKRPVPDEGLQRPLKSSTRPAPGSPVSQVPLASPAPAPAPAAEPAAAPAAPRDPAFVVPGQRLRRMAEAEFQDQAYLYTGDYPFTLAQTDKGGEAQLVR